MHAKLRSEAEYRTEWINFPPTANMNNILCVDLDWLNQGSCARTLEYTNTFKDERQGQNVKNYF